MTPQVIAGSCVGDQQRSKLFRRIRRKKTGDLRCLNYSQVDRSARLDDRTSYQQQSTGFLSLTNTAVILVNLGTPDKPDADAIRRYLKQFLSDERVVDLPRWLWLPILNLIILRTRPPRLVEKYELIWGTHDGPIRSITEALTKRVQAELPDLKIVTAMTYGNPSMASALEQVRDFDQVLVLPLFPQYAGATTGAVKDELARALEQVSIRGQVDLIEDYHTDAGYIRAVADSIRRSKLYRDSSPHLVFSFHGIPVSQSKRGDPYRDQCEKSAELIARDLQLPANRWRVTFQSRFGPAEWLQPYTDKTMEALPGEGIDHVLVACPGFSVDCLETVEEIKEQNQEIFREAGGQKFSYVKALNASMDHTHVISNLIRERLRLRAAA